MICWQYAGAESERVAIGRIQRAAAHQVRDHREKSDVIQWRHGRQRALRT